MRGIKTLWAGILAGSLLAACGAVPEGSEESVGTRAEAITVALSGGTLAVKRMRGDGAKVSAADFAKQAGLKIGDRLD